MKQFKLPDVGEGLTEAEIVSWKVKPGDTVKVNEIVVEIETAKSLVELPSPFAGVVSELLVPEGTTVDVGTPIITVDDGTGAPAAPAAPPRDDMAPAVPDPSAIGTPGEDEAVEPGLIGGPAPGGRTSVLVGYGPKTTTAARRPRKGATPVGASAATAQQAVQTSMMTMPTPVQEPSVEDAAESAPAHTVARRLERRRREGAGQAAGAQAGQGPRRRPDHRDPVRRRRGRDPRRRRVGRSRHRGRRRRPHRRTPRRPVSARPASRSRACGR